MDGRIPQKKFDNSVIKIVEVSSIRITKSINGLEFCKVWEVRYDVDIFKLTARAYSINREVDLITAGLHPLNGKANTEKNALIYCFWLC